MGVEETNSFVMWVKPSELIVSLEKTIDALSEDFYGDGAFSFATEADIQSTLLGRLRDNVLFNIRDQHVKIELAHAEFPAFGAWRQARHDLTVWRPELAKEARDNWGTHPRKWPETLQKRLNLITVELKRFAGLPWGIRQYQVFSENAQAIVDKEMQKHDDIRKLRESWCEFAYFLMFWDEDVNKKDDLRLFFKYLCQSCDKLAHETPKLHIYCVRRDGTMFKARGE